jgi:hypothetical protein
MDDAHISLDTPKPPDILTAPLSFETELSVDVIINDCDVELPLLLTLCKVSVSIVEATIPVNPLPSP